MTEVLFSPRNSLVIYQQSDWHVDVLRYRYSRTGNAVPIAYLPVIHLQGDALCRCLVVLWLLGSISGSFKTHNIHRFSLGCKNLPQVLPLMTKSKSVCFLFSVISFIFPCICYFSLPLLCEVIEETGSKGAA